MRASPLAAEPNVISGTFLGFGLVAILAAYLAIGVVVITVRKPDRKTDDSYVRSWIALGLVGGLLAFCVLAFRINDTALRSTLMGGLVANVGGAVAFYFASKSSDQARRDILAASSGGVVTIPDLVSMKISDARVQVSGIALKLVPPPKAPEDANIASQNPAAGTLARAGDAIAVFTG